jgi:DNA-binding NarL/FixJ family response regulator
MGRPRLLLADDHLLLLEGYRKLLENQFDVVALATDGRQLLELAATAKPDLILLDISMPLLNGIDGARQLRNLVPRSKILVVTMHDDPDYVVEAFHAGASGFLLKRSAAEELERAIRAVLAGSRYITPLITGSAIESLMQAPRQKPSRWTLSPRQREVLQLVAEGHTAREIAGLLHISIKTVEFHKSAIMKELGMRSIAEMTRYALRRGLVS